VLNQHRAKASDVRAEVVARLSWLGFNRINMLGRYAFFLPAQVARGDLRPLRDRQNTARGAWTTCASPSCQSRIDASQL
jgi:hypothetical protein